MITTDTKYNFNRAENNNFSWTYFDGCRGGMLFHKASGKSIYQMQWLNSEGKITEPVTGEVREQAIQFWNELNELKAQKPAPAPEYFDDAEFAEYLEFERDMNRADSDY